MGNSHINVLLRNHWANCNKSLVEWALDGSLPKMCPMIPTSNQGGRQAKNRKKRDEIFKNSSPLKLLSQSQPNFAEIILGWSQSLVEWTLDGPLPKLCPMIPTFNQDGRQAKNRKRGGCIFFKSSPLKLLSQSQPNFAEMIIGWSPSEIVSGISDLQPRWPTLPNLI